MESITESLRDAMFFAICVVVAMQDLRYRKVSNKIIALSFIVPLAIAFLPVNQRISIPEMFAGAVTGFAAFIPFYGAKKMGAGDVKFFSVLGFWLGMEPLLIVFVIGSLIACLQAVLMVLLRHPLYRSAALRLGAGPLLPANVESAPRWGTAGRGIPYAAWLAIGALAWLFHASR